MYCRNIGGLHCWAHKPSPPAVRGTKCAKPLGFACAPARLQPSHCIGPCGERHFASQKPLASYGPFHMVSPTRAELIGSIESETPAQFAALLRAFPGLSQIDMVECPGTGDDEANLALARMVRKGGISTHVPNGGSVRSGGVELFLAGAKRSAEPTAQFAVHSWMDENGLEADDYAEGDPVHREYIDFYREMGMAEPQARAFYAMTNSAAHDDALYLTSRDLARYVRLD